MKVSNRFGPIPLPTTLDGSGNGIVSFQATGDHVRITNLFVKVSTQTNQAVCTIYKGQIGDNYVLGNTNSGSTGQSIGGNIDLLDGETLYISWVGGDAGSTATATVTGSTIPFAEVGNSSLQYNEPIAAGDGSLIFPALKSPNYESGETGWYIGRDGTAEFANVTIRGQFYIPGPNNTYIQGYVTSVQIPSGHTVNLPVIDFQPSYPETFSPGAIYAYTSADPPFVQDARLGLSSPAYIPGGKKALVELRSEQTTSDTTSVELSSTYVIFQREAFTDIPPQLFVGPSFTEMGQGIIAYMGDAGDSIAVGTTETAVLNLPLTTYRANRAYEVRLHGRVAASAGGNNPIFLLKKTNTAGQTLSTIGRISCPTTQEFTIQNPNIVFTVGASDVQTVIVLTLQAPAGTVVHKGRRWVAIHDIAEAGNYPDAAVLV